MVPVNLPRYLLPYFGVYFLKTPSHPFSFKIHTQVHLFFSLPVFIHLFLVSFLKSNSLPKRKKTISFLFFFFLSYFLSALTYIFSGRGMYKTSIMRKYFYISFSLEYFTHTPFSFSFSRLLFSVDSSPS